MPALENYPFVNELITDSAGQVNKVIINLVDYQRLIELLEDEGLYRAILEVKDEVPLSLSEALQELEQE
jgi:hypothetical protein